MSPIDSLIEATRVEAIRADFPVDVEVYDRAKKDPSTPVLFAGSLVAQIAIMGRDLGKDEVAAGQPLIGAGGRLVRVGLYESRHGTPPPAKDRKIEEALDLALLTNTVPYKPPGNKAYSEGVKERFRPFIAELLATHWSGGTVLTLGTEAYKWFSRYGEPGAFDEFWAREDRYESEIGCVLVSDRGPGPAVRKPLRIAPLPHPSPLNQRWYPLFPGLLAARLAAAGATGIGG